MPGVSTGTLLAALREMLRRRARGVRTALRGSSPRDGDERQKFAKHEAMKMKEKITVERILGRGRRTGLL